MFNFFNKHKSKPAGSGVRGQLGQLGKDVGIETFKEVKKLGKEVAKGIKNIPGEFIGSRSTGAEKDQKGQEGQKEKNWADEWLKNEKKDPNTKIAEKTGGHTQINPAKISEQQSEAETARIAARLHSLYSRSSGVTGEEQRIAQEEQLKAMSPHERQQREEQQKKDQEAQKPKSEVVGGQAKQKVGLGQKRKKTPMVTGGMERKASKGKQ